MSRASLAEQSVRAGELAVLADGPMAPGWYWRRDLEAMQAASRHVGHPDGHPAARSRQYRPTEEFRQHPVEPDASGRVWRFHAVETA